MRLQIILVLVLASVLLTPAAGRAQSPDEFRQILSGLIANQQRMDASQRRIEAILEKLEAGLREVRDEHPGTRKAVAELAAELQQQRSALVAFRADRADLTRQLAALAAARPTPTSPAPPGDWAGLARELGRLNDEFEAETRRRYPTPPVRRTP